MTNGRIMDNLLSRARSQVKAVEALSQTLATEKEGLRLLHWAAQLDAIRDRVKCEVETEETRELVASAAFSEGRIEDSLWGFGVGLIKAWTKQVNDPPLVAGLNHSIDCLRKIEPFGTVMVRAGRGGLFGDVQVLCVSRMARDQRRPEWEVVAAVKAKGGELMTPEAFFRLVDAQRQKVLTGPTEPVLMAPGPEEQPGNKHAEHRQLSE